MRFVRTSLTLYTWLFKRLPLGYSFGLILFLTLYYAFLFPLLTYYVGPRVVARLVGLEGLGEATLNRFGLVPIFSALLTVVFCAAGPIAANLPAAWLYARFRRKTGRTFKMASASPSKEPAKGLIRNDARIGIVLAGGGAKGAYQAGALKGLFEFLKREEALGQVQMIAGTSIGSWNALFWLSGSMSGAAPCSIEQWWNALDAKSLIVPAPFLPMRQNYLLGTDPWRDEFDRLFGAGTAAGQSLLALCEGAHPFHFYFTRSNVPLGRLEFTTNNAEVEATHPYLPGTRPRPPVPPGTYSIARSLQDIKDAVFSSMDLPPLFPYSTLSSQTTSYECEDGGVIDNLPIRFGTEIEHCDLLFVFPLNASFVEAVNHRSITQRLMRVMNVRQGVLERNAFKMLYLYNELAELRLALHEADRALLAIGRDTMGRDKSSEKLGMAIRAAEERLRDQESDPGSADAISRGLRRNHSPVEVFSICPAPELLIDTTEFWKTREAGEAFRRMYDVTRLELDKHFMRPPEDVEMVVVSPLMVSYFRDF